jgi:hypothetical protein
VRNRQENTLFFQVYPQSMAHTCFICLEEVPISHPKQAMSTHLLSAHEWPNCSGPANTKELQPAFYWAYLFTKECLLLLRCATTKYDYLGAVRQLAPFPTDREGLARLSRKHARENYKDKSASHWKEQFMRTAGEVTATLESFPFRGINAFLLIRRRVT